MKENARYLHKKRYCYKNGKYKHSSQSVEMQCSSSTLVHKWDRDQCHYDHDSSNADGGIFGC